MEVNHKENCLCKAFGFDCEKYHQMKDEVLEILKRADTLSEAAELAYQLGKNDNERIVYTYLMGREVQRKSGAF